MKNKQNYKLPKNMKKLIEIDHDEIIQRTFMVFVQAADVVLKYADAYFYRKAGLSTIKFIVLKILDVNGGTMTPSQIAEWTNRERHNITTLIQRLKRDGFVYARRDRRDRRIINVYLTDKGRKTLKEAVSVSQEIINQVMSSIDEDNALLLEKLVRVLRQNSHTSLEEVNKLSQTQPRSIVDQPSTD